jgi:DNA-binding NarL/FixJ family response regulator
MMTLEDSEGYRRGALAAGADAFLAKNDFARDLCDVIHTVFGPCAARTS